MSPQFSEQVIQNALLNNQHNSATSTFRILVQRQKSGLPLTVNVISIGVYYYDEENDETLLGVRFLERAKT